MGGQWLGAHSQCVVVNFLFFLKRERSSCAKSVGVGAYILGAYRRMYGNTRRQLTA